MIAVGICQDRLLILTYQYMIRLEDFRLSSDCMLWAGPAARHEVRQ